MPRKTRLLMILDRACQFLALGNVKAAQADLALYRLIYASSPASTRRRWKSGN